MDGNIIDFLRTVADNGEPDKPVAGEFQTAAEAKPNLFYSDVPAVSEIVQAELILHQLEEEVNFDHPFQWPVTGGTAIIEYTTEYYADRTFLALFPRGRVDLRSPQKESVTQIVYPQHLKHQDESFARDFRFRFFSMNSVMRWQAIN